jgi:hypothetical protein
LDECHIELKRYDTETSDLLRTVEKDVPVKDINEDTILELFTKLDGVSDTILNDQEDDVKLSDEDTNLEDTDTF